MTIPIFNTNIVIMNPNIGYINRTLEQDIKANLNKNKVLIVYGARRTGKTTLLKRLFSNKETLFLSCEQLRIRETLAPDSLALKKIIGGFKTVILDEAQYLENPGLVLKVMIDNFPLLNIIASGSSSFELASKLNEPLTGRHYKFCLFPLSLEEIRKHFPATDWKFYLEQSFTYGSYPEIFQIDSDEEKTRYLATLAENYLYKDILTFNLIKNNQKIHELLLALALQIGSEVSYHELAATLSIDKKTVENYLDLLEKMFVIFRLYGFSRNLRSEINRKVKVYFYDLGVRNAIINSFNPLKLRNDAGGIFENYVISELIKKEANLPQKANFYFWRTYDQKELDLIAEKSGEIVAYEIKLKPPKRTSFSAFQSQYPQSKLEIVTMEDVLEKI